MKNMSVFKAYDILLESVKNIAKATISHIPLMIAALVIILITWIFAKVLLKLLDKVYQRTDLTVGLKDLFRQLASVFIWTLGFLIAATALFPGVTFSSILAALGVGSVAIGFAFKDIFENFIAGIFILWRFPFDPGDFITVGDTTGKVEEINIRMTLVRTLSGELVTIPNSKIFKEPTEVLTDRKIRRVMVICGVAYGENVSKSREVIRKAVDSCQTVNRSEEIQIFAREFNSSSIDFEIVYWTGSKPVDIRKSKDEVITAVKDALDESGIEIPFPYRTLTFKEPLSLTRKDNDKKDSEKLYENT